MKVDLVTTTFSQRLQQAKQELGLSNRRIVDAAAKGGHGISDYTVTQCLNGKHGRVTRPTIQALAYALRIPEMELEALAGLTKQRGHLRIEGQLEEDAGSLTRGQADAIAEVIRQLAVANRKAVGNHEDSSSSISEAGVQPAHDDELAARRTPHRRRRAGHDPEWDQMYGHQEAAHDGIPGEEIGQDHTDEP